MRLWLAALVLVGLSSVARAQNASTNGVTVGGLPLPSIGLPLPSIGLPHPPTGLPPLQVTSPRNAKPEPSPDGRGPGHGQVPAIVPVFMFPVFYTPPAPGITGTSAGAPARSAQAEASQNGRVLLDVQPGATAQIYVDGYYVGTPDDYRQGLDLPAGPHELEVRAPGFETASTSIQVPEGRTITYRASLTRGAADAGDTPSSSAVERPAEKASDAAPAPATYYVIPGCYMGNVPPAQADLPPTCDPARTITIRQ